MGWQISDSTWEPEDNLRYTPELLDKWKDIQPEISEEGESAPIYGKIKKEKKPEELKIDQKSKKITKIKNSITPLKLPEKILKYGNFQMDEPLKVVSHILQSEKSFFKIDWKLRKDGIQPLSTYFSGSVLKKKCPTVLLDFYNEQSKLFFL